MNRARTAMLLALVLLLAALLGSCGGNSPDSDGVELTLLGRKSDVEKSYMTKLFEHYEQTTGVKLNVVAYEDAAFESAAAEDFQAGRAPDIFMHFHNADLKRFDVAANFQYLNDQPWVDELTDSATAYCEDEDGNLLGLPFWESSVSGCYYNKTLLDSLGLRPATTQAEFDMLCGALAEIGHTPICWPANGCTWMFQFGLDPIFADAPELLAKLNRNEIAYADIPAVSSMAQWIADAAGKGWFGRDFLQRGWDDVSDMLSTGDAVMTFIWDTWFYTDFKPGGKYGVDDFALMPVFMNTADGGSYEGGNLNMMMVNKNGAHVDEALQFLEFCAAPENYNVAFDGISTVRVFQGQTTNIQSKMVTDAQASIARNERVSTAATRIIGYSADDVSAAFEQLFLGRTDVAGCVALMDEYRIGEASRQGAEGFPPPPEEEIDDHPAAGSDMLDGADAPPDTEAPLF